MRTKIIKAFVLQPESKRNNVDFDV